MDILKIALLQIKPGNTLDMNLRKGIECCKKAKEMGADIALFPEMWSNGYNIYNRDVETWKKEAIDINDDFVLSFSKLAKELDMAIGLTILEKYENNPKNTFILLDRFGERVLVYAKVHTCDFDVEKNLTSGDDFYVKELHTKDGDIKVGAMICYDREFPESARILMLKGAELILVPNACPMEINRLSQLRARAYENMLAIATCNYPKDVPDCNGHSSVFDGVAYIPDLEGSRDTCIKMASEEEEICIAELDVKQLRKYRSEEMQGNAYRHPEKYKCLLDKKVEEPFIRNCPERNTKDLFQYYLDKKEEIEVIKRALTDTSYKNKEQGQKDELKTNEELGTLGDSIIKFCLSEILFDEGCENITLEKEKYENDKVLVEKIAKYYKLLDYIRFDCDDNKMPQNYVYSHDENRSSHKYIATAVEAMIAAIYVKTRNLEEIKELILEWRTLIQNSPNE